MNKKILVSSGVVIAVLFAIGVYFSPHITLYQMKKAIDENDAEAFSEHVDFPALRENFKGHLLAEMGKQMNSSEMQDNPFAAFGQALAMSLINPLIDTLISPAGVQAMMEQGTTKPAEIPQSGKPAMPDPTPPTEENKEKRPEYDVSYTKWDKVMVKNEDASTDQGTFVFTRHGLWNWKLSAIELPTHAVPIK